MRRKEKRKPVHLHVEQLERRDLLAGDMVIRWNDILIETIRRDTSQAAPTYASHHGAIVSAAVFDAVNAISQQYTSYAADVVGSTSASKEAAVATAAYDTLAALYPSQVAWLDQQLAISIGPIANNAAKSAGIDIGHRVAQQLLEIRQNDGSTTSLPYTISNEPGHWNPDPSLPNQQSPLGVGWKLVRPFAIEDADTFQVPPPPDLTSSEYAAAYNEVKSLGAKNSSTRTADQTEIGLFWAYDRAGMGPPMNMYNQALQTIAEQHGNTLDENARLFALANIAMADAGIAVWNTKYSYDFWRPITAIRAGEQDANAATIGDPNWVPLGAPGGGVVQDFTPPFPAYTSGHAGFGAAMFRIIADFYGTDNYQYSLTSDELPGVVRHYSSYSQAAAENGISRIYLGIHWSFDNEMGQKQGRDVADYVFGHLLKPRPTTRGIEIGMKDGTILEANLPAQSADVSLRKNNQRLEVINNANNTIILSAGLSTIQWVQVGVQDGGKDSVRVDFSKGRFQFNGGVTVYGTPIDGDHFHVIGSSIDDTFSYTGASFNVAGLGVSLYDVFDVTIEGKAGNDSFTYNPGDALRLYASVTFDGQAGTDTANLYGSIAEDTARETPFAGSIQTANYGGYAYGTERINIYGDGGFDTARLDDSPYDDLYYVHPTNALMKAADDGYFNYVQDFLRINAYSTQGGADKAYMYDSDVNDIFTAHPGSALLMCEDSIFKNYVEGFDRVEAYSRMGGHDLAYFYDSTGNDSLDMQPNAAFMRDESGSYSNYAENWKRVEAYSRNGGYDVARLYDSAGNDTLNGQTNAALLTGDDGSYANYVESFDKVNVYSQAGGYDHASLYDSTGDDVLYAYPGTAVLTNDAGTFANYVEHFKRVDMYSRNGGYDRAYLYDGTGNDRFYMHPTGSVLYDDTGTYFNYVEAFDRVEAYARAGGYDVAYLFDSAGNDTLHAQPTASYIDDNIHSYASYAESFERTEAYSREGGYDVANLYDSAGTDFLNESPTASIISGPGFENYVESFDRVNAYGSAGGTDTAVMYDSAGNDTLENDQNSTLFQNSQMGFLNYVENFEMVTAHSVNGGLDVANVFDLAWNNKISTAGNWLGVERPGNRLDGFGFSKVRATARSGNTPQSNLNAVDYIFEKIGW